MNPDVVNGDSDGHQRTKPLEPDAEALQLRLIDLPPGLAGADRTELLKTRFTAQVEAFTNHLEAEAERTKAYQAADLSGLAAYHTAMLETSKGSLERSRQAAEAVRNAAAAIGVIYTAVLGLAFSIDQPLPPRGLVAAAFLGLAIVFATAYVGWLPTTVEESSGIEWPVDTGNLRSDSEVRTSTFILWMRRASLQRASFLRAGVVALGFGVLFLPVAFISLGPDSAPETAEAIEEFPTPPADVTAEQLELEKIRYQAQITEVAEARNGQLAAAPGESLATPGVLAVYISAAIALLIVVAVATRLRFSRHRV